MTKKWKKLLSLLLTLSMLLSILSVSAFADEANAEGDADDSIVTVGEEKEGECAGISDTDEVIDFVNPDSNETVDTEDPEESDVIDEPGETEEAGEADDPIKGDMMVGPEEIGEIENAELTGENEIMAAAAKKLR